MNLGEKYRHPYLMNLWKSLGIKIRGDYPLDVRVRILDGLWVTFGLAKELQFNWIKNGTEEDKDDA